MGLFRSKRILWKLRRKKQLSRSHEVLMEKISPRESRQIILLQRAMHLTCTEAKKDAVFLHIESQCLSTVLNKEMHSQ